MIIAVDFDGTIVQHAFPEIGKELPFAISVLKKLQKNHQIFLWTMRGHPNYAMFGHTVHLEDGRDSGKVIERDTLQEALNWCRERGLEFNGVNESPAQFSTSNKQYATLYIDDAALGCPRNQYGVDWVKVAEYLRDTGILSAEDFFDALGIYHGHYLGNPADLVK